MAQTTEDKKKTLPKFAWPLIVKRMVLMSQEISTPNKENELKANKSNDGVTSATMP